MIYKEEWCLHFTFGQHYMPAMEINHGESLLIQAEKSYFFFSIIMQNHNKRDDFVINGISIHQLLPPLANEIVEW